MTAQTTTAPHAEHSTAYMVKVIAAASIGNALEWFDLLVYGYFAVTLSKLFFPTGNDFVALMLTFGTFAVTDRAYRRQSGAELLSDRHGAGEPRRAHDHPHAPRIAVSESGAHGRRRRP